MSDDGYDQSPPPSPPTSPPPTPPPPPSPPPPAYGSPAYGAPPGYPPSSYGPAATPRTEGFAIAALVVGIVSLFLFIMVVPAIVAVVLGFVALGRTKRDPALKGKGMAVGGIVTGALSLVGMVVFIAVIALFGSSETKISKSKSERFVGAHLHPSAESVTCPDGITSKAGVTYECQVRYANGDRATATVHIVDDKGNVTVAPEDLHTNISRSKSERFVSDHLHPPAESVTCPDDITAKAGDTYECQVSYADGDRGTVTVHMVDDKGNVVVDPEDLHIQR